MNNMEQIVKRLGGATLLLAGTFFIVPELAAQTPPGGEYYIHGLYTPTIANAQKIDLRPEPIDTILPDLPVKYEMIPAKADVPARVDTISAARIGGIVAGQPRLYKGYVKGGFGLYTTPLGELYFNNTRSRKNAYGIHARHFSSNGGINNVGPSDYSFNNIDAFYKHFLPKHELSGRVIYDRRRISYYGHTLTDSILNEQNVFQHTEDDIRQVYSDIGFAGRVRSMLSDSSKISHDVDMATHAYSNLSGSREINVRIGTALAKTEGSETYGLGILIDNNAYRREFGVGIAPMRQSGTLLGLTPTVTTQGNKYLVRIGAGMYLDAMGRSTFHFYPNAYMHYRLFDDILVPYAGVEGAKQRNTFRSLTRENPFLNGAPVLANTNMRYDLYGGLRGSITSDIGFDVRVSNRRFDAMPLFINRPNPPYGDQMDVVYDRVDVFNVSAQLHYHFKDAWDVHARVDVSSYETDLQAEAWNLPPYEIAVGAKYNIRNKLILKGELLYLGTRPAKLEEFITVNDVVVPTSHSTELRGFLDLYIGAEYRYTKRLSVFLDISNLSASRYERWFRYPVQRGLVIGGFTYAF